MTLCEDCPPAGWPTDKTRCDACPVGFGSPKTRSSPPEMSVTKRNALIAEYFDKQLWQFISIDEWMAG
jgi:ribosomal protein L37E